MKYLEVPTEEQRERARKSINARAETIKRDVQHLIEWLEKQPHLPNYKDEDVLEHSLLHCKNSLEKTKKRIEIYFKARASFPEIFHNRNPYEKCLEDQRNLAMYVPLRKLTPDGCRVVVLYLSNDLKTKTDMPPTMDNFIKMNQLSVELLGKFDHTTGVILVHDLANFSLPLVAAVSSHLKKLVYLTQRAIPVSYSKMYVFNMVPGANILLRIIKPFLSKKIAKRFKILKKPTDLCKTIPKEILPKEYGGDELPLEQLKNLWFEEIKNNYDYLQSFEKISADLSKLPKDFANTELSGMEGSFRQISVD